MNVTNCRSCGRLFNVIDGERLCPECQKKLDERFLRMQKNICMSTRRLPWKIFQRN